MGYHYYGYTSSESVLTDITPPTVEVFSPAGGDVWTGGYSYDITWEASDDQGLITNPISISYSIDGGSSYTAIVTGIANSGSYAWTVPNIATTEAKIKITAVDTSGNSGYGESGKFSIIPVPTIWYVDSINGNDFTHTGRSTNDAFNTINSAESNGNMRYGDEIHVKMGTYSLTVPGTIFLSSGVHLMGGYDDSWAQINDPSLTRISGEGSVQCMHGEGLGSATTVENFTIQNGYVSGGDGGGLGLDNSSPTIKNCDFISNRAGHNAGGLASYYSSSPVVLNCSFESNSAVYGGGGIYSESSTIEILKLHLYFK